jgi:DNA-3-methyladenine glycosylase II
MTLIESQADLDDALAALAALDGVMARLIAEGARPPLRKRAPGFEGLAWIVVSQQLSTASANAIFARVQAALPELGPASILSAADEVLGGAGLSGPKIRALRSIAAALNEGALPLARLHKMQADDAHRLLTAVKGIGPWTADIYLLFCLGQADAFPAGDLAVQEAARLAFGLETRPNPKELTALAEGWRPWRGVAAKVLWAHYGLTKRREGTPVAG